VSVFWPVPGKAFFPLDALILGELGDVHLLGLPKEDKKIHGRQVSSSIFMLHDMLHGLTQPFKTLQVQYVLATLEENGLKNLKNLDTPIMRAVLEDSSRRVQVLRGFFQDLWSQHHSQEPVDRAHSQQVILGLFLLLHEETDVLTYLGADEGSSPKQTLLGEKDIRVILESIAQRSARQMEQHLQYIATRLLPTSPLTGECLLTDQQLLENLFPPSCPYIRVVSSRETEERWHMEMTFTNGKKLSWDGSAQEKEDFSSDPTKVVAQRFPEAIERYTLVRVDRGEDRVQVTALSPHGERETQGRQTLYAELKNMEDAVTLLTGAGVGVQALDAHEGDPERAKELLKEVYVGQHQVIEAFCRSAQDYAGTPPGGGGPTPGELYQRTWEENDRQLREMLETLGAGLVEGERAGSVSGQDAF
jgi:hypothetical protein